MTLILDDMALTLQSMMASRFVKPFIQEVQGWEQKLSLISEVIEEWMQVQRKWMYLESIFIGSDDIRDQLPDEAKRFDKIDKGWADIMNDTAKNTNILECCSKKNRLESLQELSEMLERCQKSLSEYLDNKRNAFPRFFFISDDELLSVLGTSDPTSVQEHMLKLYDNCAALKFGRGNKTVVGMTSAEGETLDFRADHRGRRGGGLDARRGGGDAQDAAQHRQGGVLLRQDGAQSVDFAAARHDGAGGVSNLVDVGGDRRL